MYINSNGINNSSNTPLPNEEEVKKCAKILKYIKQNDKYYNHVTSYNLKHIIEQKVGYLSNGSFITALSQCKLDYKQVNNESYSVLVKFTPYDLQLAIIKSVLEGKEPNGYSKISEIEEKLFLCVKKTCSTSIKEISLFLKKHFNLSNDNNEIIYYTLQKNPIFAFDYKNANSSGQTSDFAGDINVNLSLIKLKRILEKNM